MCKRKWVEGKEVLGTRMGSQAAARVLGLFVVLLLTAGGFTNVNAQECPDPAPQTSGYHSFRRVGETFEVPVAFADCQAVSLTVRWLNGRNNGGLFSLTFFDSDNRPVYRKRISAFHSGTAEFPLSSFDHPLNGSVSMMTIPTMVTIEAGQPFGFPATLHYTINRISPRTRSPQSSSMRGIDTNLAPGIDANLARGIDANLARGIDANLASALQTAAGRVLKDTPSYTLAEVPLSKPREVELRGRKTAVSKAFRLTIKPGQAADSPGGVDLIWINDVALPAFRNLAAGGTEVGAVIFDEAVMKNGAELALSNLEATKVTVLHERLAFQSSSQDSKTRTATVKDAQVTEQGDSGNVVAGITNAVRLIGGRRQPLVQIKLRTTRPFPPKNNALRLQVGRRFFLDELSGDHTGRSLTLTLTPEMFAELKEGADIVAFFNRPDRSGYADADVWFFGRLNKDLLKD